MSERRAPRYLMTSAVAALLAATAQRASAQATPEPNAPPPDTTTVQEPVAKPDTAPQEPPPQEPVKQEGPAHVPPERPGSTCRRSRRSDLSLLYFDPVQTYLTPYIAPEFENALGFHKKKFQWKPWERATILLKDFGDYGNAGARASPNNALILDVAPLSISMETFTPGERFFTLINHELAHVATMDVWNKQRRLLARTSCTASRCRSRNIRKPILYNFLAAPRNNVPRWYLEGSAVFFETWMAGGLGRAQGGYDEMVFRAKVRDNDKFYSPLGLESEASPSTSRSASTTISTARASFPIWP